MCVNIASETAARRYINEMYRAYGSEPHANVRNAIKQWQQYEKWLLDYDLDTCQPKAVVKAKPKRVIKARPKKLTGLPGMERLREAVREIERTTQPAPKKAPTTKREQAHA